MYKRVAESSDKKIREYSAFRDYGITKTCSHGEIEIIVKKQKLNPPERPVKTK